MAAPTPELELSEARYRTLFEYAPEGLLISTPEGVYLDANPSMCRMLGFTQEQLLGLQAADIVMPEEVPHIAPALEVIRQQFEYQREWQFLRKDGSQFAAEVVATTMPDGNILAVVRDVTERKAAEAKIRLLNSELEQRVRERTEQLELANQQLRHSRAELTGLFEALPGLYLVLTPDLQILAASDAYLKATWRTRAAIIGRPFFEVMPDNPEHAAANGVSNYTASFERVLRQNEPDTMAIQRYDVQLPDGEFEERYWSPINSPVLGADGQAKYIVHRVEDVTEFVLQKTAPENGEGSWPARLEQMQAEIFQSSQKLQATNQQLEAANRALAEFSNAVSQDLRVAEAADRVKSAFLATMSHELRTPLNSIIGFTGIVLQGLAGPLTAEQSKQLGMVRGSARHLLELINDVLDLSKIEAGQLEVREESVDLRASIEHAVALIRPFAEKKRLDLSVEMGEDVTITSDRRRVEQILLNLLNNAVKFTEHGEVRLSVARVAHFLPSSAGAKPYAGVRLQVSDTGIGIRAQDLQALFQPFRQIDSEITRQHEGTGLGLVICRKLATLLGGDISASSSWAQGSIFTLTLPIEKASHP